jgi:hypothetical protein
MHFDVSCIVAQDVHQKTLIRQYLDNRDLKFFVENKYIYLLMCNFIFYFV